jgi:hypothetical protein
MQIKMVVQPVFLRDILREGNTPCVKIFAFLCQRSKGRQGKSAGSCISSEASVGDGLIYYPVPGSLLMRYWNGCRPDTFNN